jgi:hypothetical protein
MTRKAHYARPEDHDLTDAIFPMYELLLHPLGRGAGSGVKSDAVGRLVFLGCQSRQSMDTEGEWPIRGDSHKITLDKALLKEVHREIKTRSGGSIDGLLEVLEIFEEIAATVEVKDDGDYNPLNSSIPDGVDIELNGDE